MGLHHSKSKQNKIDTRTRHQSDDGSWIQHAQLIDKSMDTLVTSSAYSDCTSSHRAPGKSSSGRRSSRLGACFGSRGGKQKNIAAPPAGSGKLQLTEGPLTCNRCDDVTGDQYLISSDDNVCDCGRPISTSSDENMSKVFWIETHKGDKSLTNYSIGWDDSCCQLDDNKQSVFDDRTLGELVRQNMAANRVYIPTAESNRRRILHWHRRQQDGVVACTEYRDTTRLRTDAAAAQKTSSHNIQHNVGNDQQQKADHCPPISGGQTTLDDSGIAVDDNRSSSPPGNTSALAHCAEQRPDSTTMKDASNGCPNVTLMATIRPRDGDRQWRSTHHWYRHRHRANNERRAMQRVAEWVDRNHNDGSHGNGRHGVRAGTATGTSLTVRLPHGGRLTLVVDNKQCQGCRRHRNAGIRRHRVVSTLADSCNSRPIAWTEQRYKPLLS